MMTHLNLTKPNNRIEYIDALRAIVLLGILIVHANAGFGLYEPHTNQGITASFHNAIAILLNGKCNIAFTFLFGVSFAMILQNKHYSMQKFIWRCVILIGFGLINKLFFWYDTLMWYGILGIIITPFRYLSSKFILIIAGIIYLSAIFIWPYFGVVSAFYHGWTPPQEPLVYDTSLYDILSRPISEGVNTYFYIILQTGGILRSIVYAISGYAIGKTNIIYNLQQLMSKYTLTILWIVTPLLIYWQYYGENTSFFYPFSKIADPIACFTYCYSFLYLYFYVRRKTKFTSVLAAYGRLGLTNYSFQAVICVSIFTTIHSTLSNSNPIFFIVFVFGVYALQTVFSYYWMKYMYYGPLEWLWRSATNLQWIPLLKRQRGCR